MKKSRPGWASRGETPLGSGMVSDGLRKVRVNVRNRSTIVVEDCLPPGKVGEQGPGHHGNQQEHREEAPAAQDQRGHENGPSKWMVQHSGRIVAGEVRCATEDGVRTTTHRNGRQQPTEMAEAAAAGAKLARQLVRNHVWTSASRCPK